jgi:hypothetical protein
MAFFNKKEEVIDLELTPYGEAILAEGKFRPAYYAFFDDDILYDAECASLTEVQNSTEPRIQENTPGTKVQYSFSGLETRLTEQIQVIRADSNVDVDEMKEILQPVLDRNYSLCEPIGTMNIGSKYAPAWDAQILRGELSGAINYFTSSLTAVKRIPQLDFDLNYDLAIAHTDLEDMTGPAATQRISQVYPDGTFLYTTRNQTDLILSIDEENTPLDTDYDIEVFLVESGSFDSEEVLQPLFFEEGIQYVVNDILVDNPVIPRQPVLNSSYVEYFFQVNNDFDIPEEEICGLIEELKARGIRVDDLPFNCDDVFKVKKIDIYPPGPDAEC